MKRVCLQSLWNKELQDIQFVEIQYTKGFLDLKKDIEARLRELDFLNDLDAYNKKLT